MMGDGRWKPDKGSINEKKPPNQDGELRRKIDDLIEGCQWKTS